METSISLSSDDFSHISRIHTQWSIVLEARKTRSDLAGALARAEIVCRYNGAIFRYFRRLLGNPQDAEDLTQEIALKILDGALVGADREKGRFRDYVKVIVINAARTHRQKRQQSEMPNCNPWTTRLSTDSSTAMKLSQSGKNVFGKTSSLLP